MTAEYGSSMWRIEHDDPTTLTQAIKNAVLSLAHPENMVEVSMDTFLTVIASYTQKDFCESSVNPQLRIWFGNRVHIADNGDTLVIHEGVYDPGGSSHFHALVARTCETEKTEAPGRYGKKKTKYRPWRSGDLGV